MDVHASCMESHGITHGFPWNYHEMFFGGGEMSSVMSGAPTPHLTCHVHVYKIASLGGFISVGALHFPFPGVLRW